MTLQEIAQKIPDHYRKEILETKQIELAVPSVSSAPMMQLGTVWKNYVNDSEDLSCGLCLERILKNYQQLRQVFIDLEKEKRLLDTL